MAKISENPLLSSKPSDSGLTVSLHPLVLLTASDQITRHRVRNEISPVVGLLLGQQRGREITAEHAFSAAVSKSEWNGRWSFQQDWLEQRIQQYRDVHKAPALDAVGWFTLCPEDGPLPEFVPLQEQISTLYNDGGILLAIHPEAFETTQATNGKLPLTIYESVYELDPSKDEASMQVDGEEISDIKFRPLPYTVETDEAEMIAIDYVAKGAGSAAAVAEPEKQVASEQAEADQKGKKRADTPAVQKPSNGNEEHTDNLNTDEQDQIAGITTRLNSVKMLQSRLSLLTKFIQSLPPSHLSDQNNPLTTTSPDPTHLPHLRSIQALLTRLSLLTPASEVQTLQSASQAQSNDVALTSMLSLLNQDVQSLAELGRKFATVDGPRSAKGKGKAGLGGLVVSAALTTTTAKSVALPCGEGCLSEVTALLQDECGEEWRRAPRCGKQAFATSGDAVNGTFSICYPQVAQVPLF